MQDFQDRDRPALRILGPDETIHSFAPATDARVLVTDRRLAVIRADRVLLDVPFERLRRIQFDIERERPATLVLVPDLASDEPQVLSIPVEGYAEVAKGLALVGQKLHGLG